MRDWPLSPNHISRQCTPAPSSGGVPTNFKACWVPDGLCRLAFRFHSQEVQNGPRAEADHTRHSSAARGSPSHGRWAAHPQPYKTTLLAFFFAFYSWRSRTARHSYYVHRTWTTAHVCDAMARAQGAGPRAYACHAGAGILRFCVARCSFLGPAAGAARPAARTI